MVSNHSGNYLFAPVVEWNEVQEFKEKNTDYLLPSSYQEYLQNHPLSVIKRFPFSIIEISLMSIRHLGIFLFITIKYYFSDTHKKKSFRSMNSIEEKINIYADKLPVLENDTKNIIEYVEKSNEKKKEKI